MVDLIYLLVIAAQVAVTVLLVAAFARLSLPEAASR